MAGVYIYRDSVMGKALKRDLCLDGQCVGASAPDLFFYKEVSGVNLKNRHRIKVLPQHPGTDG
jgi:hypothetical protein